MYDNYVFINDIKCNWFIPIIAHLQFEKGVYTYAHGSLKLYHFIHFI